jgi:hypothetical protein
MVEAGKTSEKREENFLKNWRWHATTRLEQTEPFNNDKNENTTCRLPRTMTGVSAHDQ